MAFPIKLNVGAIKDTLDAGVKAAQGGIKETLDAGVKAAQDGVKAAQDGVKAAQDGISSIKIDEVVQDAAEKASSGAAAIGKAIGNATKKAPEQDDGPTCRDLIALHWCMAYADGEITDEERATLGELCCALDEGYPGYAEEIERECSQKIAELSKEFGHRSAVKIEVQKLIESLDVASADAKLFCWNLMAIAGSDSFDESETDLIRFVGEKIGVDPAVLEELRNYADAIAEIEKSIEHLKQSNRSYGEIEPLIGEFAKRQQVLIEAAQSLVTDR